MCARDGATEGHGMAAPGASESGSEWGAGGAFRVCPGVHRRCRDDDGVEHVRSGRETENLENWKSSMLTSAPEFQIFRISGFRPPPAAPGVGRVVLEGWYNRRLRRQAKLTFFILAEDERGYLTLQLRQSMKLPKHSAGRVICLFRSRRAAESRLREWVAQHGLCQRLTGLERKSSGACFAWQLMKCRGACCGQESAAAYNQRLLEVVDNWHIKVWPYDSPHIIEEKGEDMTAYHLVDQWRHLDTQAAPGLLQTPTDLPMEFD